MNKLAAINTAKLFAFALACGTVIPLMAFNYPKVLLAISLTGLVIGAVKMVYDSERDRLEILSRLNKIS